MVETYVGYAVGAAILGFIVWKVILPKLKKMKGGCDCK